MTVSTEKKVGLFFLLALVALGILIEAVEDWNPFEGRVPYHAFFRSAVGIKKGDPVRIGGVEIGKIEEISLDQGRVRIDFYVTEGTRIKADSVARIRQTNLLGGQFLGLDFGSEGSQTLPPDSSVPSMESTNIDQLIANLDRNQERVLGELGELVAETRRPLAETAARFESITRKIDEGEGALGLLVNDPALYEETQGAVASLRSVLESMERGEGTIGRLMQDPALYDEAKVTMGNLRLFSDQVIAGKGTLGRLYADESLYDNASGAFAQMQEAALKANSGNGTLGKLLNDGALYDDTRAAMSRVASIAAKIDEGQGTLGRLVNEDDLYRDAKTTLHKVEKTVDGMSDSGPLSALGVVLGTLF